VATVSTYSRLKAAGRRHQTVKTAATVSTHSRLKAAGPDALKALITGFKFQHRTQQIQYYQYLM